MFRSNPVSFLFLILVGVGFCLKEQLSLKNELDFQPPPSPKPKPIPKVPDCAGVCKTGSFVEGGILTSDCSLGGSCEVFCPDGRNPRTNTTCWCLSPGVEPTVVSTTDQNICLHVQHMPKTPSRKCLVDEQQLIKDVVTFCSVNSTCFSPLPTGCCDLLFELSNCQPTVFESFVKMCDPTREDILGFYTKNCPLTECPVNFNSSNAHYSTNCSSIEPRMGAGTTCTVTCADGYSPVRPPTLSQFKCLPGNLSIPDLECEKSICTVPSLPDGMIYAPDSQCNNSIIEKGVSCSVSCEADFEMLPKGSNVGIIGPCLAGGILPSMNFSCNVKQCVIPDFSSFLYNLSPTSSGNCVKGGMINSGESCNLACPDDFNDPSNGGMRITCKNSILTMPSEFCTPNTQSPFFASCDQQCTAEYLKCQQIAKNNLNSTNIDSICSCFETFNTCIQSNSGCINTEHKSSMFDALYGICSSSDCVTSYKSAMQSCADSSAKCLEPNFSEDCCQKVAIASTNCPILPNVALLNYLYSSFVPSEYCSNPVSEIYHQAQKSCSLKPSPLARILPPAVTPTPTISPSVIYSPSPLPTESELTEVIDETSGRNHAAGFSGVQSSANKQGSPITIDNKKSIQPVFQRGNLEQLNHEDNADNDFFSTKNVVGVVDRFLSPVIPFSHTIIESIMKGQARAKRKW